MRISDSTVLKLLERGGTATEEQVNALKEEGGHSGRPLQDLVIANRLLDEPALTKLFAEYADIPYIELKPADI